MLKDVGLAAVSQSLTRALVWPLARLLWPEQFSHLELIGNLEFWNEFAMIHDDPFCCRHLLSFVILL